MVIFVIAAAAVLIIWWYLATKAKVAYNYFRNTIFDLQRVTLGMSKSDVMAKFPSDTWTNDGDAAGFIRSDYSMHFHPSYEFDSQDRLCSFSVIVGGTNPILRKAYQDLYRFFASRYKDDMAPFFAAFNSINPTHAFAVGSTVIHLSAEDKPAAALSGQIVECGAFQIYLSCTPSEHANLGGKASSAPPPLPTSATMKCEGTDRHHSVTERPTQLSDSGTMPHSGMGFLETISLTDCERIMEREKAFPSTCIREWELLKQQWAAGDKIRTFTTLKVDKDGHSHLNDGIALIRNDLVICKIEGLQGPSHSQRTGLYSWERTAQPPPTQPSQSAKCRHADCNQPTTQFSVFCSRHHKEMLRQAKTC